MNSKKAKGLGTLLAGIGIGAGLGILFAPKSGKETRADLKKQFDEFVDEVKKIDINEAKDEFLAKVDEIKAGLADLDKEKVIAFAKEKSEDIKKKTADLVELAKEKGTPILEDMATSLRKKAIDVTKDIQKKLEEK